MQADTQLSVFFRTIMWASALVFLWGGLGFVFIVTIESPPMK